MSEARSGCLGKKNIILEKECVTSFEKHDLKIFNSVVKKIFGLLRAVMSG